MNREEDELHLTLFAAALGAIVALAAFGKFELALYGLVAVVIDGLWLLYAMDSAASHGNPATSRRRTWLRFGRGFAVGLMLPVPFFAWTPALMLAALPLAILAYQFHRRLKALEMVDG